MVCKVQIDFDLSYYFISTNNLGGDLQGGLHILRQQTFSTDCQEQWQDFHLHCYMDKDGSKIFTKPMLEYLIRRLEFMVEICNNALDNKLTLEESHKRWEEIQLKYADCETKALHNIE